MIWLNLKHKREVETNPNSQLPSMQLDHTPRDKREMGTGKSGSWTSTISQVRPPPSLTSKVKSPPCCPLQLLGTSTTMPHVNPAAAANPRSPAGPFSEQEEREKKISMGRTPIFMGGPIETIWDCTLHSPVLPLSIYRAQEKKKGNEERDAEMGDHVRDRKLTPDSAKNHFRILLPVLKKPHQIWTNTPFLAMFKDAPSFIMQYYIKFWDIWYNINLLISDNAVDWYYKLLADANMKF